MAAVLLSGLSASAQQFTGPEGPIITRGVAYLKAHANDRQVGEAALAGLALVKCEVPPNDPVLQMIVNRIKGRFKEGRYDPDNEGGSGIYEAAVALMFLSNLSPATYKAELEGLTRFLIGRQLPSGGWDYSYRSAGDTSISQYALLGLWEAANAGVEIAPEVWDRAALWYLSVQSSAGSWNYHRDEPQWAETVAMTGAGAGSLLICQMQLQRFFKALEPPSPLMTPLFPEGQAIYEPKVSSKTLNAATRRGVGWIGSRFVISEDESRFGQSSFYTLYGIERIAALGGPEIMKGIDWYRQGFRYIQARQQSDGSWNAKHDILPNTCWALLFLAKATAQTVQKIEIKRLGAGTLLGGRGLPRDLSTLTVAGGRVMVRPMGGAIEGMLAVLEDPRSEQVESAMAGLIDQYNARGPSALRPLKDRFRKLMTDRDPTNRAVGAWGLGRIGEIDAAPLLIKALEDADEGVVQEARVGLQVLSRKIEGPGPPVGSTSEQRAQAARQWQAWFDSIRPPGFNLDDLDRVPSRR
jgi:hypothetical protein